MPELDLQRSLIDFPYYAANVLWIKNKKARLQKFTLNRPQRRLWYDEIEPRIQAGEPVRGYLLKARQLGFSTFTQGLLYWVSSTREFRSSLVVSHEDRSASSLFNKSEVFFRFSPEELRPMTRQANRNELYFANPSIRAADPGLESRILVQTANNKNLGASLTLDFVHLSELARYEDLLTDVDASMTALLQTVPYEAWTFVIIETTAQGLGYAKDIWDDQDNGYFKFFTSWVAADDYTAPLPVPEQMLDGDPRGKWGNEFEIFDVVWAEHEKWYPEITDDDERKHEVLKRMQWRRRMISANFRGKLDLFRQEYPLTAEEAFITSGNQVFNTRKIVDLKYALTDQDSSQLRFSPATYRFDHEVKDFYRAPFGPLRLYEEPKAHGAYVIGGDVSEGIISPEQEGDESVLHVIEVGPTFKTVAVYQDHIKPDELADVAYALGKLYNWAMIGVENNGPGVATNLKLTQVLYYPNLYQREVFDGQERKYTKKVGWHTNRASKPVMITALRAALDEDTLIWRDIPTLDQMMTYVVRKEGTREVMGAVQGKRDDLVIAAAIALQVAVQQGSSVAHSRVPRVMEGTFEWWAERANRGREDGYLGYDSYKGYLE